MTEKQKDNRIKSQVNEIKRLRQENEQLKSENQKLNIENTDLKDELHSLFNETMRQIDIMNKYGIPKSTLRRHIALGKLKPMKSDNKIFLKLDVESYINDNAIKIKKAVKTLSSSKSNIKFKLEKKSTKLNKDNYKKELNLKEKIKCTFWYFL